MHTLGKRWSIPIVEMLGSSNEGLQFNEMQLLLGNITPTNLNKSLKELIKREIVSRARKNSKKAVYMEYSLTEKGKVVTEFIRSAKRLGILFYGIDPSCTNKSCNECTIKAGLPAI